MQFTLWQMFRLTTFVAILAAAITYCGVVGIYIWLHMMAGQYLIISHNRLQTPQARIPEFIAGALLTAIGGLAVVYRAIVER